MNKNKRGYTTYIINIPKKLVQKQTHVLGQIQNLKNMMCLDPIFQKVLEANHKPKSFVFLGHKVVK